jgi:hypothetical protein
MHSRVGNASLANPGGQRPISTHTAERVGYRMDHLHDNGGQQGPVLREERLVQRLGARLPWAGGAGAGGYEVTGAGNHRTIQ